MAVFSLSGFGFYSSHHCTEIEPIFYTTYCSLMITGTCKWVLKSNNNSWLLSHTSHISGACMRIPESVCRTRRTENDLMVCIIKSMKLFRTFLECTAHNKDKALEEIMFYIAISSPPRHPPHVQIPRGYVWSRSIVTNNMISITYI